MKSLAVVILALSLCQVLSSPTPAVQDAIDVPAEDASVDSNANGDAVLQKVITIEVDPKDDQLNELKAAIQKVLISLNQSIKELDNVMDMDVVKAIEKLVEKEKKERDGDESDDEESENETEDESDGSDGSDDESDGSDSDRKSDDSDDE